MTSATIQNGARNADGIPPATAKVADVRIEMVSLADLLSHLNMRPTSQLPMLRSAAGKIAAYLGQSVDQIALDLVHAKREGFRPYLETQRYKDTSVRSYVNYLRILLEEAKSVGWEPHAHLSDEWRLVLDTATKMKGKNCVAVLKLFSTVRDSPLDITQEDFARWIEQEVQRGTRYVSARQRVDTAWRTLVQCGYAKNAPTSFLRRKKYGIPLSQFPPRLRAEAEELIRWKSAEFEEDRPTEAKIRGVSARGLRYTMASLFGYATNIAALNEIDSLEKLVQKRVVGGFLSWCLNEQKLIGGPLAAQLGCLLAALSMHPDHKTRDFDWFRSLLATVPFEPYEKVKARKAKKYLPYEVLARIPQKIHARRKAEQSLGRAHTARLAMEELMIAWLLVFAWRQRNLRECRVTGSNPNLFKGMVEECSDIDKPAWAVKQEAQRSDSQFWQVQFTPDETKTGVAVHSLVPRQLVPLLEEYLLHHRPVLLNGRSCEGLFVSPAAHEMSAKCLTDIVSDVTLRYGGRRVTPHLFRDVVAYAWLKAHRGDYLTLSKMLWHRDVRTTINYYASRFNDSSAVVAMEEWLEEREERKEK